MKFSMLYMPLHSEKTGIWCTVNIQTVKTHWYVNDMLSPFFHQLTNEERNYRLFQQHNATAHSAENCIGAESKVFEERLISKGP